MKKIYAISDIHGHIEAFGEVLSMINLDDSDNALVLLGDYIHGHDSYAVLDRVMELEQKYGRDRVIVLMGNHEEFVLMGLCGIDESDDVHREPKDTEKYLKWMNGLRLYYKTDRQIFCHAGIDESAGDLWEWGTPEATFVGKMPPQKGRFYMDIIAGHTGTQTISGIPGYHDVYYDGKSHFYIDGSVNNGGRLAVLMIDLDKRTYYELKADGLHKIKSYRA